MVSTALNPLFITLAALAAGIAGFARAQNRGRFTGGPISLPKTLWLGYALAMFYVLPWFLWRGGPLSPPDRRLFGVIFFWFALRAPIEGWMIYARRSWRCGYGIGHDLIALGVLLTGAALAFRRDGINAPLAPWAALLAATLAIEAYFAWRFSRVASPADGTYYAAHEPRFHRINRLTWGALALLAPGLLALLLLHRRAW